MNWRASKCFYLKEKVFRRLDAILKAYISELKAYNVANQDLRLENIYFENRDLKMLIDLLALNSGVGSALQVISIFDKVCMPLVYLKR